MIKKLPFLLCILASAITLFSFLPVPLIRADEVDDLTKQINDLTKSLNDSINATKPLESELKTLQAQITSIKQRVSSIEADLVQKEKDINQGYKRLDKQKEVLAATVRHFYIQSHHDTPLLTFLASSDASEMTNLLAYQKAAQDQDKVILTNIALSVQTLEDKKQILEEEQTKLRLAKANLDEQTTKLDKVVKGAKDYQATLSSKIGELSAKQQSILSARSGTFTASIGDSELADDVNASIKGFRDNAPSGYFAVFSFGAHTHRKGMSQYGARGRAQSGQDYKAILKAYYGKEPENKDTGGDIAVSGNGSMNFEDRYLLGIAEMPSSWHPEALKAQAVAARTYAYRYKVDGKEICTTEACQVFSSSKADNAPQAWKDAVSATKGQIIDGVTTFYASTHGGFTTTSGWDTTDGSGGGSFIDKSYEKIGGSPWLYKAWYTKAYSVTSDKCGRSNPWLSPEELADIINATRYRDDRVTPVTTSCYPGTNPYSMSELAGKAQGPSSVSSVTVSQGNGTTNEIVFQTNIGEIKVSGADFKTAFNLRAPGFLSIPQSGFAFYNIEKK